MNIDSRLFIAMCLALGLQPIAFARNGVEDGVVLYQKQQYQAAKRQLLKATASDPTNAAAQYHLANTYVHLGEHQLAQKHYRVASLLDPGGTYGRFAAQALAGYNGSSATSSPAPSPQPLMSGASVFQTTGFAPKYSEERSMLYQHGVWQKDDGSGAINLNLPPHTNNPIGGHSSIPGVHRTPSYYVNPGGYSGFNPGYGTSGYLTPTNSSQHSSDRHHDRHHNDHHD